MLRDKMVTESVDLVAIGPGPHMKWLLGFHPHADERPCLACISANGAGLLMPGLNAEGTRAQTDLQFFEWSDDEGPNKAFGQLLLSLDAESAAKIVLDETMRADFAALVQDALPDATRQFSASTLGALRMCKDADEIALLQRNAKIADKAMRAGWAAMKPGITEQEVAQIICAEFTAHGAIPLFSIIGTGSNGAFPHHQASKSILQAGDAVVMDIGGAIDGFSSDMTRMAVLGAPPQGYEDVHAVVEAAVLAAMKAARPGVKAHEVDDAARAVIAAAGYGEYFVHRTGHGMGVEPHEPPWLTSVSETVLEEGMVFSIEPGIYLPGRFGIRLEDIVVLRHDGPEILSELPRTLQVI